MAPKRKQKKRLYANALTALKAKNTEAASNPDAVSVPPTVEEALVILANNFEATIKDELSRFDTSMIPPFELLNTIVEGISEGVTQELRATNLPEDQVKELAREFILGLKEGMRDELEVMAKENQSTFKETIKTVEKVIVDGSSVSRGDAVISSGDTKSIEEKASSLLAKAQAPIKSSTKYTPYTFLRSVALESIGLSELSQSKLEEETRKSTFIESMKSQGVDEKTASRVYESRKEMVAELEQVTAKLEDVKNSGALTDEQIKKLPETELRDRIVSVLTEKTTNSSQSEEVEREREITQERITDAEEQQVGVLYEIRDLLAESIKTDAAAAAKIQEKLESGTHQSPVMPDIDVDLPGKKSPSGKKGGLGSAAKRLGASVMNGISKLAPLAMSPIGLGVAAVGALAYAGYSTYKDKQELQDLTDRAEEAKRTGNLDLLSKDEWIRYQTLSEELGETQPSKVEAVNANQIETTPKPIPKSVAVPSDSTSSVAAEIGKHITIQAPAPVIIPSPPAPNNIQLMPTPFANGIRNSESTISKYIGSKY